MADSDNSRTLSTVTRGEFHSSVAASFPTYPEVATRQNPGFGRCTNDPAVAAWQHWGAAWSRLSESTLHQQQLETSLFSEAVPSTHRLRAYNEALEEEDCAATVEERAAEALWKVPAVSVAGVIAKLDAILNRGQPSLTCIDEPWPQLRGVIADLLRIDTAVAPPCRPPAHERQPVPQDG